MEEMKDLQVRDITDYLLTSQMIKFKRQDTNEEFIAKISDFEWYSM